jgi:hypothetical protein
MIRAKCARKHTVTRTHRLPKLALFLYKQTLSSQHIPSKMALSQLLLEEAMTEYERSIGSEAASARGT